MKKRIFFFTQDFLKLLLFQNKIEFSTKIDTAIKICETSTPNEKPIKATAENCAGSRWEKKEWTGGNCGKQWTKEGRGSVQTAGKGTMKRDE